MAKTKEVLEALSNIVTIMKENFAPQEWNSPAIQAILNAVVYDACNYVSLFLHEK